MPELPEVETVVRGLRASLKGRTITDVVVRWPGSIAAPDPERFAERVQGRTVVDVHRRGKWILVALDDDQTLLAHLRMTGQLIVESAGSPVDEYTRIIFSLDGDRRLRFSDVRKFGRLVLTTEPDSIVGELGPEPLADDFTVEVFRNLLAERRARMKSLLLDQTFLAGLGNIYVNEALWEAGIHPLRPADSLSTEEVEKLYRALRSVLRAAIREGGTTLDNGNFKQANGEEGAYARHLLVYGREGEPCPCCGCLIERMKVGQRGTYLCKECQPACEP